MDQIFPDLRTFLDQLRQDGDLAVVSAAVDPYLEAAEIHRRVVAAGGPALLFERVIGADFPITTNLFGTPRRAEMAFGRRPRRLIERLVEVAGQIMPPTPTKLWGARDLATQAFRIGVRRSRNAPVTEVVTSEP